MKWTRNFVATLVATLIVGSQASAAVLYSQNFEPPVPPSSTAAAFGGFGQINNVSGTGWQVQGGGGGGGISVVTGVDANGAGGSQGLFANFDHSAATGFTFNQYTVYGAIGAPGVGTPASAVKVDLDIFISGSTTNNPLQVTIQSTGDTSFTPILADGAYTHVSFTLAQTDLPGNYNPANSANLRIVHGAGGFGFDAGNIVRIDNVVVQTIPEPAAGAMLMAGAMILVRRRRR